MYALNNYHNGDIMIEKDSRHWEDEDYRQRMTSKQWRELLLANEDKCIFHGRLRKLVADNLGAGVFEVYKERLQVPVGDRL